MNLFHDEENGPQEPIKGLPQLPPKGERILWQGQPSAMALAVHAFHIRFVALYFIAMTGWRMAFLVYEQGAADRARDVLFSSLAFGFTALALLILLAGVMARFAIYTITNKRVVLRFGAAIRKYVNLPFNRMTSAKLKLHGNRVGDIALEMNGPGQVGYFYLWPFARPLKFGHPQPMLRSLRNPEEVANILARAVKAENPTGIDMTPQSETAQAEPSNTAPGMAEAV